ncbi:MAG: Do family serine endopeptidase [Balneolaceae bacterium]
MNHTIKNIFGVAAAIIVLLSFNMVTNFDNNEPDTLNNDETKVEKQVAETNERSVNSIIDLNKEIVDIAEKTNPAVVTITTEKIEEVRMINPFSQFFGNPRQGNGDTREFVRRGLGSGVIVSEEGYILTNNHVIEDVDQIKVILFNGDEVDAELIGTDRGTDIAVLKVDVNNIPTVTIGQSESLKVGSFVLAIGSPLSADLAHTVSFGIVSAKGRSLDRLSTFGDYIQTDAAINPGNSGGALIDMNGELVGINSAIASRSGGNEGIGFAIPIDLAKRIMDDLVNEGEVSRGYLGMQMAGEVDQTMARALKLDDARGIIVGRVEEGGPAAQAGLQEQDVIVSVNGEAIKGWSSFRTTIAGSKPNEEIELGIIRDGDEETLNVTLGKKPTENTASVTPDNNESLNEVLGFAVRSLTAQIRSQLELDNNVKGVLVESIQQTSNAYNRGLRQYDVITSVQKNDVSTPAEFYNELENATQEGEEVILLSVIRQDVNMYIAFEM